MMRSRAVPLCSVLWAQHISWHGWTSFEKCLLYIVQAFLTHNWLRVGMSHLGGLAGGVRMAITSKFSW